MNGQACEMFVPFSQPRVEDRRIGDEHRLVMIWGGHGGLVAEADDNLRAVPPKLRGQRNARLEAVE